MTTQISKPERKPPGRPFPKGTSGNPGGRPKEAREVVEALRLFGDEMVAQLKKLVRKGNIEAIKVSMAYAYGKPVDTVRIQGHDGGPLHADLSKATADELQLMERMLDRLGPTEPTPPATH